ncbi:hypothetical protein NQ318_019544 [Aromia moschata]|uniref:Uncharacterized protein n=1 Tax=Aromia moschata TaxID=1265417 RepID=A0AAV8XAP9_9CUCU|nr:hypothetical protein NQ318_019544 [Aromia moschata]
MYAVRFGITLDVLYNFFEETCQVGEAVDIDLGGRNRVTFPRDTPSAVFGALLREFDQNRSIPSNFPNETGTIPNHILELHNQNQSSRTNLRNLDSAQATLTPLANSNQNSRIIYLIYHRDISYST